MVLKEFKLISFLLIGTLLLSSFGSAAATGILASPGSFQVKFSNIQNYTGQETVENTGNYLLKYYCSCPAYAKG